jgi:hypothetical protein
MIEKGDLTVNVGTMLPLADSRLAPERRVDEADIALPPVLICEYTPQLKIGHHQS